MNKPLVLCFLLLSFYAHAQQGGFGRHYWEAGFLFGLTDYSGDLSEKPVEIRHTHPGYGAYLRYHFSRNFAVKAHVYSGTISGDDANTARYDRHFRFSTSLVEVATVAEWYPLGRDRVTATGVHRSFISPYLFAGIGVTFADALAEYYGSIEKQKIYLKVPFPEEGLQHRFLLTPIGGGIRFDMSEYLVVSLEGGLRPVYSDDIDGIRRNGNPKSGDWYYFSGVTVSFILGRPKK
jgi:hypothetical protein